MPNLLLMNATLIGTDIVDVDNWNHDEWRIELNYMGRAESFSYRTGTGHRVNDSPFAPNLGSVMVNLASDYEARQESSDIADYADSYGYGTDSVRRLITVWSALTENRDKLASLFGDQTELILMGINWERFDVEGLYRIEVPS